MNVVVPPAGMSGPWKPERLHILGLCCGAGGLELGIHLAEPDARGVCYVEREAHAAATLVARMEDAALDIAPVWDDVTSFDGAPWRGKVDCVAAGFPCQPVSVAGKRRGSDDDRWLWDDVARIIGEVRPQYVFLENVRNLINLGLEGVRGDLHGLGYQVEAGIFSAAEVGAPHRRERIFVLAHTENADRRGKLQSGAAGSGRHGFARGGEPLAHTAQLSQRKPHNQTRPEPRQVSRQNIGGGGGAMEHSAGTRRVAGESGPGGAVRHQGRRPEPERRGGAVGYANGERREQTERGEPENDGYNPSGNPELGYTSRQGLARRRQCCDPQGRQEPLVHAGLAGRNLDDAETQRCGKTGVDIGGCEERASGGGLPLFPPGPGDRGGWDAISAAAPHLEPAVCRMADGLADELDPRAPGIEFRPPAPDEYLRHALFARVDRLRLTGNGVHPLAAAYAWRTLKARCTASGGAGSADDTEEF